MLLLLAYWIADSYQNVLILAKNLRSLKAQECYNRQFPELTYTLLKWSVCCFADRGSVTSTESEKVFMKRFKEILKENAFHVYVFYPSDLGDSWDGTDVSGQIWFENVFLGQAESQWRKGWDSKKGVWKQAQRTTYIQSHWSNKFPTVSDHIQYKFFCNEL